MSTGDGLFRRKMRFRQIVVSQPGENLRPNFVGRLGYRRQVVLYVSREMLDVLLGLSEDFADGFQFFDERLDDL